ncbi:hypothetical protein BC938DRAFT_476705 [Jimgerdemannia flammicorona]|uniref:Uncharacterized protein n=1 Tax=Jimgerdemannia flammicorona TaxID=994334 RepID=A0A433QQ98_9FUNG|nr:hypothetical protein BC938DRAFT_476705 [Jimgerdemannia flammicorona]
MSHHSCPVHPSRNMQYGDQIHHGKATTELGSHQKEHPDTQNDANTPIHCTFRSVYPSSSSPNFGITIGLHTFFIIAPTRPFQPIGADT